MKLPYFQSAMREFSQMQVQWIAILNPIIADPENSGLILSNIKLINGANTINHLLARMQQGWYLVDVDAVATIYRSQPFNDKTLTLTSNAPCIVSLKVF